MAFRRGDRWLASWYEGGSAGRRRTKSCPSRELAETIEEHMRAREIMIRMGLTTRRDAEVASKSRTPVPKLVDLHHRALVGRGVTAIYARETKRCALAALDCFRTICEVNAEQLGAWLTAGVRDERWSPRTWNHYLKAARAVMRWAVENEYLGEDPLRSLRLREDPAATKERRALTVGEFR